MNKNAIAELVVAWPAINSFDIVKVIVISVKVSTLFSFSAFDINVCLIDIRYLWGRCCWYHKYGSMFVAVFLHFSSMFTMKNLFLKNILSLKCAKYNFYYFCFCIIQISGHLDLGFFFLQNVCTSDFQKRMDFNALIGWF